MRLLLSSALVLLAGSATNAFAPVSTTNTISCSRTSTTPIFMSEAAAVAESSETNMADSGKPPEHANTASANVDDAEIPTKLPSDVGMDYVPLATMLATGQLAEADQVRSIE